MREPTCFTDELSFQYIRTTYYTGGFKYFLRVHGLDGVIEKANRHYKEKMSATKLDPKQLAESTTKWERHLSEQKKIIDSEFRSLLDGI